MKYMYMFIQQCRAKYSGRYVLWDFAGHRLTGGVPLCVMQAPALVVLPAVNMSLMGVAVVYVSLPDAVEFDRGTG